MFSQTAEYALRAMVWIADHPGRFVNSTEIAQATQVPFNYLLKILQTLSEAKLLESKRGLKGGVKLAKSADKIALLEIIQIFDPIQRIRSCPLGLKEHERSLCPLHHKMDELAHEMECHLGMTFLSDLVERKQGAIKC